MLTDSQELQVDVITRAVDRQLLQAAVYAHRVSDSLELQATVRPLMSDSVQLRATIINQALAAAAAEPVLAPDADITFV